MLRRKYLFPLLLMQSSTSFPNPSFVLYLFLLLQHKVPVIVIYLCCFYQFYKNNFYLLDISENFRNQWYLMIIEM
jgi:hypothetical protein